jgi:FkbM family methyltransferase
MIVKTATLNLTLGSANRKFQLRPGSSDEGVIDQVFKHSDYNFKRLQRGAELTKSYERVASSNKAPLIIDAGANIGASPIYFAYSFPKARLVAIEPERDNFELLSANTQGLPVECIRGALASKPGSIDLVDPGKGSWAFRASSAGEGKTINQTVDCVTINDIYAAHAQDCSPFIAKIDIEGGEHDLFSANTEWVAKTPLIIIELHDWLLAGTANSRPFLQCISSHDRDFVYIGENIFSIDNHLLAAGAA